PLFHCCVRFWRERGGICNYFFTRFCVYLWANFCIEEQTCPFSISTKTKIKGSKTYFKSWYPFWFANGCYFRRCGSYYGSRCKIWFPNCWWLWCCTTFGYYHYASGSIAGCLGK